MRNSFQLLLLIGNILIYESSHAQNAAEWVSPSAFSRHRNNKGNNLLHNTQNENGKDENDYLDSATKELERNNEDVTVNINNKQKNKDLDFLSSAYDNLVSFILNKRKMKHDSTMYHRNLHLEISEKQLEKFQQYKASGSVRDIDGLLFDIIEQSEHANAYVEILQTWTERILVRINWFLSNRIVSLVLIVFAFALASYLCRKFEINLVILLMVAAVLFLYKYLDEECQRENEIEVVVQLLDKNQPNPCESRHSSIWSYLFSNPKAECRKFLEKTYEKSCSIRQLYNKFFSIFVYGQMNLFFESIAELLHNTYATYGIVILLVFTLLFYAHLGTFIISIFKYVISPALFGNKRHSKKETNNVAAAALIDDSHRRSTGDRLSGENITRLLNITESHSKLFEKLSKTLESSGVSAVQNIVPEVAELELHNKSRIEERSSALKTIKSKVVVKEIRKKENESAKTNEKEHQQQCDDDDTDAEDDIVHIKFDDSKELESDQDENIHDIVSL